ncbi:MAG: PEP-CTERM sorting domain-containing protein [Planctomycetia bacterium]|nr:PEP-CTERM sorting domain-containing protein [Planctomycetia bacterium]
MRNRSEKNSKKSPFWQKCAPAGMLLAALTVTGTGSAYAGPLFTAPESYDAKTAPQTEGTIDNAKNWVYNDGTAITEADRVLGLNHFGTFTSRYTTLKSGKKYLIDAGNHSSNTGWGIANNDFYMVDAGASLTMLHVDIAGLYIDSRTVIKEASFNQSAGKLTLNHGSFYIGDSGTGVYNLEGGNFLISNTAGASSNTTLNLRSYDFYVGSSISTPGTAGTGTFNIAGGTAILPGKIYVGYPSTDANVKNTGTVNQTGGLVNASGLEIHNGTYTFTGGSIQLTDTMLNSSATYTDKSYNIAKDIKMTGGTLSLGKSGVNVTGNFTGNLDLSGDAQFKLYGAGGGSRFGGTDTVVNISDSASFYANSAYIAASGNDKVTFNMSGGELFFDGNPAVAENGTVIINQTGGTFKGGGWIANGGGSVVMNLSGGTLEGTFGQGIGIRGTVEINISGNYKWNGGNNEQSILYGWNASTVINQMSADSAVSMKSLYLGNTNDTGDTGSTYNLSAGTLTLDKFYINGNKPKLTGTLNLKALTDDAGKFSTPVTGGTATITDVTDINVNATAGKLTISGTYKMSEHAGTTLAVGSQTDSAGAQTFGDVTVGKLENINLNVSGGMLEVGTITQNQGTSVISGGEVTVGNWTLNDDATLALTFSEDFNPITIENSFSGNGTLEVDFAEGFTSNSNAFTLFTLADGATFDLDSLNLGVNGTFFIYQSGNNIVMEGLPEPSTWILLFSGIAFLGVFSRKKVAQKV